MTGATAQGAGMFDALLLPDLAPPHLLGLESYLLEAVAARACAPALLVYALSPHTVSLGRYHLYGGADQHGGITGMRRMTGGRVVGAGPGWIGLALILPSRTALLPEWDRRLTPEQMMNRYVRGLLGALRAMGIEAFYPGRDAITVERREIAMCTVECDERGAALFEASLAVNRGMEELIRDLERFDPSSQLNCAMYGPDSATKVVREIDRDVSFGEIAAALVEGYGAVLGGANRREPTPLEIAQAEQRAASRKDEFSFEIPSADALSNRMQSQLGVVETRVTLAPDGSIARFGVFGDFIANSPAIRALERELTGKPFEFATVSSAVMKIFAQGDNFILGIGDLSNLVNLVMRAQ